MVDVLEVKVAETVFILGAGASRHAGAPLTADFLDKADAIHKKLPSGPDRDAFGKVFEARSKLQLVHSKAQLNLDNIESVFAAFEMGRVADRLPGIGGRAEAEELLTCLRRVISLTLQDAIMYPVRDTIIRPTAAYEAFAELIALLCPPGAAARCSVVSFNYDVALDFALFHKLGSVNYCMKGDERAAGPPVLKLHGSLNWTRCSECGKLVALRIQDMWHDGKARHRQGAEGPLLVVTMLENLASDQRFSHCTGKNLVSEPFLVPPTWNKMSYYADTVLGGLWQRAATELANAENIFVFGYSLTESDLPFRYLYGLGSAAGPPIKRFWVFDPAPEQQGVELEKRFRGLIGYGVESRFRLFRERFEPAVVTATRELVA